jgi:hypothetical protein
MRKQMRLLFGISIFWVALSMLFDGTNTLVLPLQLNARTNQQTQATVLGLLALSFARSGACGQPRWHRCSLRLVAEEA